MAASRPRVFNIPASVPFLPALVGALRDGRLVPGFPAGDGPLAFARATLYLPTRRACRLARDVFLDVMDGDAAILPRIVALGDLDEDEIAFAEAATGALAEEALALPLAITSLERRLLLAELILKWANSPEVRGAGGSPLIANTPSAALGLADDLARLMDDMTTRQIGWDRLDGLVPEDLDTYWQLSLRFLKIARETWPAMRAERGAIEAAERRDLLIEAEARRLAGTSDPVIAAGSTGSMPATAKLLATIARLPHGAVVLPGLDMDLSDDAWRQIADEGAGARQKRQDGHQGSQGSHEALPVAAHPQFAMQALLGRIGIARDEVGQIEMPHPHGREAFVSEALRPAATTDHWWQSRASVSFDAAVSTVLSSVAVIEAANPEEEALTIAAVLREALETPGKRAALVTPDRALARRVVAALARWQVAVDDSGGDALADTSAGVFARLVAEVALGRLEPVPLLALLKHPLLRLSAGPRVHDAAAATLERALLRGPRPNAGSAGLADALATFRTTQHELHASDPAGHIGPGELDAAGDLIARLAAALAPLEHAPAELPLAQFAARHRAVVATLGGDARKAIDAFTGHDGTVLADAFQKLIESPSAAGLAVSRGDYAELFQAAIADRTVRRPETRDVRVHIYGPLEARLQSVDRIVLGGLNEGTWPGETRNDPWLSRPMRRDLGLDPPERRIGLSAHDFAQALGAPEVFLSRATKVAGAPTVTSRFVQRMAALADDTWKDLRARGAVYLDLARDLDHPAEVKPVAQPAPRPPLAARPKQLSVTAIEHWLRDPYTIYARYILRLQPLDAVDTPPGARDRGTLIHDAVGDYTARFAAGAPADPLDELHKLGKHHFAPLKAFPEARAFWWPRFERIALWFMQWDGERRTDILRLYAETTGKIDIPLGDTTFSLSARADRIEQLTDGRYVILDYKTGQLPGHDEVKVGFAPQLTLEAAILRSGGFADIPRGHSVSELTYVGLKGGDPAGQIRTVNLKDTTPDTAADDALKKLRHIAHRFLVDGEPYRSLVSPKWKGRRYGDYDHLARVKEWSLTGGEIEENGE